MKIISKLACLIAYLGISFFGLHEFGSAYSSVLLVVLSGLFVFCYVAITGGLSLIAISTVFVFTFVFPVGVLFAIGLPVYHSWSGTLNSLVSSFTQNYQFFGLEMLFPLFAAFVGAWVAHRLRSNPAFKRDALKRAP
jgi:hypothetical protein